jgi:tetratricopeptide (TPR) repeat protein
MRIAAACALALAAALPLAAQEEKPKPEAVARELVEKAKERHGPSAIEMYDEALKHDPSLVDAWVGRAMERWTEDPALALADLARAEAAKDGWHERVSFWRGVILMEGLLDRAGAWQEFDRVARRAQNTGLSFCAAGVQKLLMGRMDEAEEHCDKAVQADKNVPYGNRFRAIAAFEFGSPMATNAAAEAVRVWPEDPATQAADALVRGSDDWTVAVKELDRILQERPKYAWAHVAKAKALFKHRKFEEALAALDAADKAAPGGPEVAYMRGKVLAEQGKLDEADASLSNAWNWDQNFGNAIRARADLRFKRHDWSGALRDLDSCKRFALTPQDQKEIGDLIEKTASKKRLDEGVVVSAKGLAARAEKFALDGEFDRAEKDLAAAQAADEKEPQVYLSKMRVRAKKKDLDGVFAACQEGMDRDHRAFAWLYDETPQQPRQDWKDWFEEICKDPSFVERARKLTMKDPWNRYTRATLYYNKATELTKAGNASAADPLFREGAAEYEKVGTDFPDHSLAMHTWYNGACSWALVKETDKAMAFLLKAAERGWGKEASQIDHMERDTDLTILKEDPRFTELVKKLREAVVK